MHLGLGSPLHKQQESKISYFHLIVANRHADIQINELSMHKGNAAHNYFVMRNFLLSSHVIANTNKPKRIRTIPPASMR
jgi:hypothetical protein